MNGKKLVELVVEKMKEMGLPLEWPECAKWGGQDDDWSFYFFHNQKPTFSDGEWNPYGNCEVSWYSICGVGLDDIAVDQETLLTKEIFENYVNNLNPVEVEMEKVVENNVGVETMRNRILIIDETLSGLKKERHSLINRIREAGFEVIVPEVEQVEGDGSSWKNWQVGDTVKLINNCEYTSMKKDQIGVITYIDCNDGINQNIKVDDQYWPNIDNLIRIKKKGQ